MKERVTIQWWYISHYTILLKHLKFNTSHYTSENYCNQMFSTLIDLSLPSFTISHEKAVKTWIYILLLLTAA